jgi:hypothetical protein
LKPYRKYYLTLAKLNQKPISETSEDQKKYFQTAEVLRKISQE